MSVYYKFKSAKDYDSVAVEGHFISVGQLKEKIFELKHLGRGTDFDLVVTNAQSNEEYLDEGNLIAKNTSVLICRVPGRPRKPIVTAPVTEQEMSIVENNFGDNVQPVKDNLAGAQSSAMKYSDDLDWDEFGNDLYAIPEPVSVKSSVPVQESAPVSKEDEDNMIKALVDTPALADWTRQPSDSYGSGRGFGRNMGGRNMGGRGFGRGGFENKKPPEGYICHRCKTPGHFIQHCPTNGDPNFDVKRFKPPTGIPKSMLIATPDGSYTLPSGVVAVMKPNLDTFEKDMPSTRSVGELPPELHCPICTEVMKDAVLTSKCCFTSFCDKCIRDHIISKSMCVCGATSILADDLLPNKTLRDTINRILESNNSSDENGGRTHQLQDMESRNPQAKAPSPTQSAASRGQQQVAAPTLQREESSKVHVLVEEEKADTSNVAQKQENGTVPKVPDVSEATHDSRGVKEAASHGSAQLAEEEVHQKPTSGDAGKKKKKKKTRMNPGEADMHWRNGQELAPENYMMPMGPSGFNPYWNGMQPGFDGFMPPPFHPGPMPPYMGYGPGPMDIPFGAGMMPHDPFGMGGMMPYGPPPVQRDLAELAMGFHGRQPAMSREQFEARKADLKRKRDLERHREREFSKDREYGREVNSAVNGSPMKSKSKSSHRPSSDHHHRSERQSSPDRRSRDPELPRPSSKKKSERDYPNEDGVYKKKSSDREHTRNEDANRHHRSRDHDVDDHRHHRSSSSQRSRSEAQLDSDAVAAEKKQKASVFSRISFPENESAPKRRKSSSASESAVEPSKSSHKPTPVSNGYPAEHSKRSSAVADMDHDSSDDERHFKRRPSRYTSSPPLEAVEEEGIRHAKVSRERERERDRGYSKYR